MTLLQRLANSRVSDPSLHSMMHELRRMEAVLRNEDGRARVSAPPFFSFEDGPIAQAAKLGLAVLLEDIDAPSQVECPLVCPRPAHSRHTRLSRRPS
jgi:hypothetical protein